MESPSKRTKAESRALKLMDLPPEVRDEIILNLTELADVIILMRVNKELALWMQENDIVRRWQERYLGDNEAWRSFLLQLFAFQDEIWFIRGPSTVIISYLRDDPAMVSLRIDDQWAKRLYDGMVPGTQWDLADWNENYFEANAVDRVRLYQFAYQLMDKGGYGVFAQEEQGNRFIRACIACGEEAQHTCASCQDVTYCGEACQSADWSIHQEECIGAKQGRRRKCKANLRKTLVKF